MIDRDEAGRRIRAAREANNLTQTEAASLLGMSRQQFWQIETGTRVPAWPLLVDIVMILGLDPKAIVPEFFA